MCRINLDICYDTANAARGIDPEVFDMESNGGFGKSVFCLGNCKMWSVAAK